ncbi:MAG: dihydrolipoamide acetyltransferase family protein [Bacteroidales bacterium]|jgi:2-oxoglutarate dehydrogenase E2 component (dihydrolipoamide succinyltransferase)|nr:dihydrolipoamide acetyltransferase family protein [Bacteroidales bacterium]
MGKIEIYLPAMGEGVIEATITKWLVKEGSEVEEDDPVVEVATDKVDTEIPSPASGILKNIAFKEGDIPKVGDVLAYIESEAIETASEESEPDVEKDFNEVKKASSAYLAHKEEDEKESVMMQSRTPGGKYLSPLVRKIASTENISFEQLDSIKGTGMDGRITSDDIKNYISSGYSRSKPLKDESKETVEKEEKQKQPEPKQQSLTAEGDEIIEMGRVRKLIAEHMVRSKQTSPHVTSYIDVDITDIVRWREKIKDKFMKREGMKLTLTPIFIEATARAIRQVPLINVTVDGDRIIKKKNINIGMATALPDGNLIVPVIKKADEKSIIGLAREVNDLAERARNNKLKPEDITGGTFSITNYGTVGTLMGSPIINQPQAAILGIGAAKKMPAVIESPAGDSIGIRNIVYLSLSYDHRIVDGALGGLFLKKMKENLEGFMKNKFIEDLSL